ncbi:MAG: hypothetical protein J6K32_10755 [Clostridia bacterium]|nr:hypothetical protein [Clostridia bacterium]
MKKNKTPNASEILGYVMLAAAAVYMVYSLIWGDGEFLLLMACMAVLCMIIIPPVVWLQKKFMANVDEERWRGVPLILELKWKLERIIRNHRMRRTQPEEKPEEKLQKEQPAQKQPVEPTQMEQPEEKPQREQNAQKRTEQGSGAKRWLPAIFTAAGQPYQQELQLTACRTETERVYRDVYGRTVLALCERFPCFDSEDYLYENRYYRWYFILHDGRLTLVRTQDESEKYTVTENITRACLEKCGLDSYNRDVFRKMEFEQYLSEDA